MKKILNISRLGWLMRFLVVTLLPGCNVEDQIEGGAENEGQGSAFESEPVAQDKLAILFGGGLASIQASYASQNDRKRSVFNTPVTVFNARHELVGTHIIISPSEVESYEPSVDHLSAIWVGKTLFFVPSEQIYIEVDKYGDPKLEPNLWTSEPIIPAPEDLTAARITLEAEDWSPSAISASLRGGKEARALHWMYDAIGAESEGSTVSVPYLSKTEGPFWFYQYQLTAWGSLTGDLIDHNASTMKDMFGHLGRMYAKAVGDVWQRDLEESLEVIVKIPAFPFNDPVEGHGSLLFHGDREDDEWDMLIMTFDVENSLHSESGETTELTVIMPIYLSPQISIQDLRQIMAHVGDSYHATSIAVRDYEDYELAEEPSTTLELQQLKYRHALNHWSNRKSYTDVGLAE